MKETKTKKGVVDDARVDNGGSLIVAFYSNVVNNRAACCCPLGNRPMMRWWIDLPASISSVEVRGGVVLVSCCWKSYPVRSSSTERRACFECGMKEVQKGSSLLRFNSQLSDPGRVLFTDIGRFPEHLHRLPSNL